jgi:hypothetical protein
VAALVGLCASTVAFGQSDNFDDGNDAGWTRYSPLAAFGAGAQYSFPNGAYRIKSPGSPNVELVGNARAGSLRHDKTYTRFRAAVDVIGYDAALRQSVGLVARISDLGLGATDGYTLNYNPQSGFLQITPVLDERPSGTVAEKQVRILAQPPFRLVFTGIGSELLGQMFAPDHPEVPLGSVFGVHEAFDRGACGVFVFDLNGPDPADATFDNYAADDNPGTARATLLNVSPKPGEQPTDPIDFLSVEILSRETALDPATVQFAVNGAAVNFQLDTSGNPALLAYTPTVPLPADLSHRARLTFDDGQGARTFEWSFGAPAPTPSVKLESAAAVVGPYAEETSAVNDSQASQFVLPRPSGNRFFRLRPDNSRPMFGRVRVEGDKLVLPYTLIL